MRTRLFTLAWAFVIFVAGYDALFAWNHRELFSLWEMNPVARWVAGLFGLGTVLILKSLAVAFGASVGAYCHHRRHPLELPYTLLVSSVHFALSVHYVVGQLIS
jgi:hypothetical protein